MDAQKAETDVARNLDKIVKTRLLLKRYSQTEVQGIMAKKRQIICGIDAKHSNGRSKMGIYWM